MFSPSPQSLWCYINQLHRLSNQQTGFALLLHEIYGYPYIIKTCLCVIQLFRFFFIIINFDIILKSGSDLKTGDSCLFKIFRNANPSKLPISAVSLYENHFHTEEVVVLKEDSSIDPLLVGLEDCKVSLGNKTT